MTVKIEAVCPQRLASEPHIGLCFVMQVYHFPLPVTAAVPFFDEVDLYLLTRVVLWTFQGIVGRGDDGQVFLENV